MSRQDDCRECKKYAIVERDACDEHADRLPPGVAAGCRSLGHQLDYKVPLDGLNVPCVHIGHARCRRCHRNVRYWFRILAGELPVEDVIEPRRVLR